jgi:hypothetical protein
VEPIRRMDLNRRRADALLADTVALHQVPAWSVPIFPRNAGINVAPSPARWNEKTVPNAGAYHETARQQMSRSINGRTYGGR